jgi:hypothetical protein
MLATSDIPPLDSDHPNWLRNVKTFAQTKILSAIFDLISNQSIFEQMLSTRILNLTLPFTAEQTELVVSSNFSSSFQQAPSRAASPSYSDSEDSAPLDGYEKVLDTRHRAHKAFVRTMLKSHEHSPDTAARLQSFLATPSRPADSPLHLDSLTSSPSTAFSLIQLLSPVEKNRPILKFYKPDDVYSFLSKFDNYRRQRGQFSAALCLFPPNLHEFRLPTNLKIQPIIWLLLRA